MKTFLRIFSLLITLSLVFALASCGTAEQAEDTTDETTATSETLALPDITGTWAEENDDTVKLTVEDVGDGFSYAFLIEKTVENTTVYWEYVAEYNEEDGTFFCDGAGYESVTVTENDTSTEITDYSDGTATFTCADGVITIDSTDETMASFVFVAEQ